MLQLHKLFEVNPQPMLVYRLDTLELLEVNDAFCEHYGYERSELIGKPILVLHRPEDHPSVRAVLQPLQKGSVRGKRRVTNGLRLLRKDGSTAEFEAVGQPVEHLGRPARLVVIHDLADRRRAEIAEQRLAAMVARSSDIVLFIAHDGRILEANPAAVRSYGHSREQLLRMRIADLREPATAGEIRSQMAHAVGEGIVFETVHRRSDGSTFPVEVDSAGVDVAGERVLISIIRDLTASRAAEEELRRAAARIAELQRVLEESQGPGPEPRPRSKR